MREEILKLRSEWLSFDKIWKIMWRHKSFVSRICKGGRIRDEVYPNRWIRKVCQHCHYPLDVAWRRLCNLCWSKPKMFRLRETGEYKIHPSWWIAPSIRKFLIKEAEYKCTVCWRGERNTTTWNVPLQIHHQDWNYKNNSKENLTVLCPNCHSLTENYWALNRGKGREWRKTNNSGVVI